MTTVILATVWLSDAANSSDYMSFPLMGGLSRKRSRNASFDTMASGRQRRIISAGSPRSWSLDLPNCTRDQLDWLESHGEATLCVRDDRGHKFFAGFSDDDIAEHAYDLEGDFTLTLQEITFSEAV